MQTRRDIDLFRLVGAFGIVWYHSGAPGHEIAYGALIAFIVISTYLASQKQPANGFAKRRARRLLTPWIIWYFSYLALNIATNRSPLPYGGSWPARLLAGPSYHLWYVPFAFAYLTTFDFARSRVSPSFLAVSSAILSAILLSTTRLWRDGSSELGYPYAQYIHASAAVLIGIFFSYIHSLPKMVAISLIGAIFSSALAATPYREVGIPYLIGIGIGTIISLLPTNPRIKGLSQASSYSFGVFLIHVFLLSAAIRFFSLHGVALPLAVFSLSLIAIYMIASTAPGLSKYLF